MDPQLPQQPSGQVPDIPQRTSIFKSKRFFFGLCGVVFLVGLVGAGGYLLGRNTILPGTQPQTANKSADSVSTKTAPTATAVDLATTTETLKHTSVSLSKLPLGDQMYASSPKKGYVYLCHAQSDVSAGGAQTAGPWIDQANKTWDLTKKIRISGNVSWPNARWTVSDDGATRILTGNGLPYHTTGVYPVATTDPAYQYDRNPNSIREQILSLSLPANPTELSSPDCVGGEVGIMLSGIPLFNAFDAGGRDADAWEVQDSCSGHPQVSGQYHYHGYSSCVKDTSNSTEHSSLLGYAFDGFGIYGLKGEGGTEISTKDLDECHGHMHTITWDGQAKNMYHYHLTHDFPYSVSCFRGKKAISSPLSNSTSSKTGMQGAGQNGQMQGGHNRQMPPPPSEMPPMLYDN